MTASTNSIPNTCVVILGPTACGKTRLAVHLAQGYGGEIISVDSRQVYCGLDIGSGKDLQEYAGVPYHLIDVIESTQEFNLYEFIRLGLKAFHDVKGRKRLPVFAGGTGLFLDALLRGHRLTVAPVSPSLRQELEELTQEERVTRLRRLGPLHNETDLLDPARTIRAIEVAEASRRGDAADISLQVSPLVIGIKCQGEELRARITHRLRQRLEFGMVEEVEALREQGISWERLHDFGLEYRYVAAYLRQEMNRNDMEQKLAAAIYQFARQQLKWFRRFERQGVQIHWLSVAEAERICSEGFPADLATRIEAL